MSMGCAGGGCPPARPVRGAARKRGTFVKRLALALALLAVPLLAIDAGAGTLPADVPALGYSPRHLDRTVDPRQDFYRYAAGTWLTTTEIGPSDADVGSFTLLARRLDSQLLAQVKDAAAATDAPPGSPRRQVGDFYRAAMDTARRDALGLQPLAADLQRIAMAGDTPADVAGAPLLHLDAFHQAFGTRPGDPMWRDPAQRVVIW